jgi:magnesium-transporting ATPase (P-type)
MSHQVDHRPDEQQKADPDPRAHGLRRRWFMSNWWIVAGAVIVALVAFMARMVVGRYFTGDQARDLVEAMTGSALFLAAAIATGSATIIALMLTLLGLARDAHDEFRRAFHDRIRTIAWLATVSLVGAVLVLVTMTIPVVESEAIPVDWYRNLWWVFSGAIAAVSGLFVSVVITLLVTVIGAVDVLTPDPPGDR